MYAFSDGMMALGDEDQEIALDASGSGCQNEYCLHDALINKSPWDPSYFDLESDYGQFDDDHEVQTDYFRYI